MLKYWTLPIGDLTCSYPSWSARLLPGRSKSITIGDAWRRLVKGIEDYESHITQGLQMLLPEFLEPRGTPTTFFSNKKASTEGVKAIQSSLAHISREVGLTKGLGLLAKMNQKDGFDCPGCAWPDPDDDRSNKIHKRCQVSNAEKASLKKTRHAKNSLLPPLMTLMPMDAVTASCP